MKFDALKVAKKIEVPISKWPGNCAWIANLMLAHKLVPSGVAVRGNWIGPITTKNHFKDRPFTGHTWIQTPDGTIVDPTRWAFSENAPAEIYVGPNDGNYDIGGNIIRHMNRRPFPEFDEAAAEWLDLTIGAAERIAMVVASNGGINNLSDWTCQFSKDQLFWISNLDPADLGEYAKEIYLSLSAIHWEAAIPFDNWNMIVGAKKPRAKKK